MADAMTCSPPGENLCRRDTFAALLVMLVGRCMLHRPSSFRSSAHVLSSPRHVVPMAMLFFEGLDDGDNKVSLLRFLSCVLKRLMEL